MTGNLPQPRVLLPHAYSMRIANTIPYLPTRTRFSPVHASLPRITSGEINFAEFLIAVKMMNFDGIS
jgi:hypothetical protein